jgi:GNAT superfamily N-acetyltransferase
MTRDQLIIKRVVLTNSRQRQVKAILAELALPAGFSIRAWAEADFPAIQRLSSAEGWSTPADRPDDALVSWRNAWPTLVAIHGQTIIGFVRALTDGEVTMYIAELLVAPEWRGGGVGGALLETCHLLFPHTRLDLLSTESADQFYEASGFRRFQGFRKSYI